MTRTGWAWLDDRAAEPHRVKVAISEGKNGGLRTVPIAEADKEVFLEHVRGGGTISLSEVGSAEEQQDFRDGLQEGFAESGGLTGLLASRAKPIDKEQRKGP